jgi:hypothetical protein
MTLAFPLATTPLPSPSREVLTLLAPQRLHRIHPQRLPRRQITRQHREPRQKHRHRDARHHIQFPYLGEIPREDPRQP